MSFSDSSLLVVSTQCSKEGEFSCALYNAVVAKNDEAVFKTISTHVEAATCLARARTRLQLCGATIPACCWNDEEASIFNLVRPAFKHRSVISLTSNYFVVLLLTGTFPKTDTLKFPRVRRF